MELTPENVKAVMKDYYANVTGEEFAADVAAAAGKSAPGSKLDRAEKVSRRPSNKTSKRVAKLPAKS